MQLKDFDQLAQRSPAFLLGANSGEGFCNHFGEVYRPKNGDRLYILKGGPGTGKSTFMKKLALFMANNGQPCELYYCSSDPRSLDGVLFPQIHAAIVDGTAPHVMEPTYLGVSERVVNLGDCLNMDMLEAKREQLVPLYEQNRVMHQRASRFLKAASGLVNDNFALDCECSDLQKAEQTAQKLCEQYIPKMGNQGKERKRFLSSVSPDGLVLFEETLQRYASQIVAVEDEYGGSSSVILSVIRHYALEHGHSIITCPCSLTPSRKIDHILIPSADVAFCTTNTLLPITVDTKRRVHANRFRNVEMLAAYKQRLRFNRRAAEELLDGACFSVSQARDIHDSMESYYINAMDFRLADNRLEQVKRELLQRMGQYQ